MPTMNVTFSCPKCEQPARVELRPLTAETSTAAMPESAGFACPHCRVPIRIPSGAIEQGRLTRCLVCPSVDLFVRKDIPQRIGVGLFLAGAVGSSIAWGYGSLGWTFGILFASLGLDLALYLVVSDQLMCYRCHAEYRGVPHLDDHHQFSLETHEKYRQLAARTAGEPR